MKKLFTFLIVLVCVTGTTGSYAQCDAPANLVSSYSNNVSTFTWDPVPGATGYFFDIAWAGGTLGAGEFPTTTNSFNYANLMQGGNFVWGVRATCASGTSVYTTALFSTPCLQPYNLAATNITTASAVLNWQQSSGINNNNTGFSVSYRLANSNNAWIQLTNVYNNPTATFFNLTGLAPATAYEWRVRRICSFSNSNYLTSQFVTLACISSGVNTSEWIRQFTLGNINRASAAEPGGYTNISSPGTDLVIGSTNNAGQIGAGFASTVRNEKFMVFIDFNRNGSFADAGENMISNNNATISGTTLKNFSINIPVTATPGPTRMRVIMNRNSNITNPCITGYWGETEDYMVNLVASGNLQAPNQPAQTKTVEIKTAVIPESKNMISLNVSPNPSSGLFTIDLPATFKPVKYMVVNSMGKTVQQSRLNNIDRIIVNISGSPKGIYYLTVFDINAKKTTAKLIVQ